MNTMQTLSTMALNTPLSTNIKSSSPSPALVFRSAKLAAPSSSHAGILRPIQAISSGSSPSSSPIYLSASPDQATPQTSKLVGYQGCPGAYSEAAAMKACPGLELLPCDQFEVAFQALSQYACCRAVLPIENSLGGSIHAVYDLLLRYRLHIVGETSISVNHCLLALPGVEKSQIKRVLSHPQALAQTDGYTRQMPGVVREAVDDTAGAAQMIAENGWRDAAAVASRRAGELYGMNILDEGIQDMKDNVTRFIVLAREPLVTTAEDSSLYKTSIVFSLKEGPGVLFKALSVFALRDINMTKIESRPMRENPLFTSDDGSNGEARRGFNYIFYLDFLGSLADPTCQNALRHLEEIAPFLRILGSYPRDKF
jgi:arogenate/prephenate dehydratase